MSVLIILWSIALGYGIRGLRTAVKVTITTPEKVTQYIEFGAISCSLTGALNRIGLRKYFDQNACVALKLFKLRRILVICDVSLSTTKTILSFKTTSTELRIQFQS